VWENAQALAKESYVIFSGSIYRKFQRFDPEFVQYAFSRMTNNSAVRKLPIT